MVDLLQNTLLILHMFNLLQSDQLVEGQGFQGVIGGGGRVVDEGDRGEGTWNGKVCLLLSEVMLKGTKFILHLYCLCNSNKCIYLIAKGDKKLFYFTCKIYVNCHSLCS